MKKVSFLMTVIVAFVLVTSCQPPKTGGSDAPVGGNESGLQDIQPQKKDSSIEKAIHKEEVAPQDTTKPKI